MVTYKLDVVVAIKIGAYLHEVPILCNKKSLIQTHWDKRMSETILLVCKNNVLSI